MKDKLYKIIVDGVALYVNEAGRIGKRDKGGRIRWMKQTEKASNSAGNPYLVISLNGKKYLAHRICLAAFSGGIMSNLEVDHANGIRRDNRKENLFWVTRSQNARNRHAGARCEMPKAADWLVNGERVQSWQELAA